MPVIEIIRFEQISFYNVKPQGGKDNYHHRSSKNFCPLLLCQRPAQTALPGMMKRERQAAVSAKYSLGPWKKQAPCQKEQDKTNQTPVILKINLVGRCHHMTAPKGASYWALFLS
uniref:Uncharacterized protein n=1 Tax=Rhizophora mucronata TaxID=61149 RepID=A0A2P2ME41_RHIMU